MEVSPEAKQVSQKKKIPWSKTIEQGHFLSQTGAYLSGEFVFQKKVELSHYLMNKLSSFTGVKLDENFLNWHMSSFVGSMMLTTMGKMYLDKMTAILPENKLTRFVRKNSHIISAGAVVAGLFAYEAGHLVTGYRSELDTKDIMYQTAGPILTALMLPKHEQQSVQPVDEKNEVPTLTQQQPEHKDFNFVS